MKVVFLDIDGVLTTVTWKGYQEFNPICTGLLKSFLETSGYKIVISSTWRWEGINNGSPLDIQLDKYDLKKYLVEDWRTLRLTAQRGVEIKDWLMRHPEVDHYIILDDDCDMLEEQKDNFIQTSAMNGLLFEHWEELKKKAGIGQILITLPNI